MSHTVIEKQEKAVHVVAGGVTVEGNLVLPEGATGIVLFAHGSGMRCHLGRFVQLHSEGLACS